MTNVVAVDPQTVRIELSEPYAPLLAVLADRSGMILSPAALTKLGDKVGTAPVCSGPYKFAERVPQDDGPDPAPGPAGRTGPVLRL